jgi:hypothetical protein
MMWVLAKRGTARYLRVGGGSASSFDWDTLSWSTTSPAHQTIAPVSHPFGDGWYWLPVFRSATGLFDISPSSTSGTSFNFNQSSVETVMVAAVQLSRSFLPQIGNVNYYKTTGSQFYGPRFDHDTTSPFACRGLLIEEQRANSVFPSETLTTQTRTVTAVPHTLSFYGTGTVVLSGVHSATVNGTGAYPTRTTLTFTPTAGSLTLTVTGSVTQAQLEAGSFPTSYIPTTIGPATRSADVCSITAGAFNGFYNQPEGTFFASAMIANLVGENRGIAQIDNGDNLHHIRIVYGNTNGGFHNSVRANDASNQLGNNAGSANVSQKLIISYQGTSYAGTVNGATVTTATRTQPTGLSTLRIGSLTGPFYVGGHIAAIRYFRKRLPDAKLQSLTAP